MISFKNSQQFEGNSKKDASEKNKQSSNTEGAENQKQCS